MIRSFKHRGLKRLYEKGDRGSLPPEMVERIEEILGLLDILRLHPLSGDLKGHWAVTVRANWRIVFRFDNEPEHVDFTDYH